MKSTKVSDLSISEFKSLIKETMIETLESYGISEVDEGEQQELEIMFGKKPKKEKYSEEKTIEI